MTNTQVDAIVKEFEKDFLNYSDGNAMMRDNETRVYDWLRTKLTTYGAEERQVGRNEAVEYIQRHGAMKYSPDRLGDLERHIENARNDNSNESQPKTNPLSESK